MKLRAVHIAAMLVFLIGLHRGETGSVIAEKLRVCYFTDWSRDYPSPGTFNVGRIDPDLCTHLIWAYAKLNSNYQLAITNGNDNLRYLTFNALKEGRTLTTLLSVGGWDQGSERFSVMASNPNLRTQFVLNAVTFLKTWGFDGLDLKWEYPGSQGGLEQDKNNYIALIQLTKIIFANEGLILSAAVPAGITYIAPGYNIPLMAAHLDFINLMSYDFHGAWDTATGFNSPLFERDEQNTYAAMLNVKWAAEYWVKHGIPAEKLIIGLPTDGRTFTLADSNDYGVGASVTGTGEAGVTTQIAGKLAYYEICQKIEARNGSEFWDSEHKCAYYVEGDQWIGYDNIYSMIAKAEWIIDNDYGGAMFWTLDQDDFSGLCNSSLRKYPLISTVKDIFDGLVPPTPTTPEPMTTVAPVTPDSGFCVSKEDGFYVDPVSCTGFYECITEQTYFRTCAANLYYNRITGKCDWPINVVCEDGDRPPTTTVAPIEFCDDKVDGLYADVYNCSMYYECWTECTFHEICPDGQQFDASRGRCRRSTAFACTDLTTTVPATTTTAEFTTPSTPFCADKRDGYYKNPYDCGSYYRCVSNNNNLFDCPSDTLYDAEMLTCRPENDVDCSLKGDTTGFCLTNTGLHPYPYDCKKFYNCANGLSYIFTCPSPYLFSDVNLYCDWEYLIDCGNRTIV